MTDLDDRYGRRPRGANRRLQVAALGVFVVVALAWAAWAGVGLSRSSIRWTNVRVDASDPGQVRVAFDLSLAAGRAAVCAVRATDAAGAVVGWLDVPVAPSASGTSGVSAQVRTSLPAVGGGVSSCVRR